ncbi:MAG TPA: FeoA family protein [Terriglobia bacterium]|nr:FeoA family protein [Terriglobia bacterium]
MDGPVVCNLQFQLQLIIFMRTDTMSSRNDVWRFLCSGRTLMPSIAGLDPAVNLYQAKPHSLLRISLISGGWGVRRNLNQMGLHVGDEVSIIHKAPFGGPLVIESRGNRVAIGQQLAQKIGVEVVK